MPIADGFDLLNYFPNRDFLTIFITAHEEYAIKAIRVGAIDYLLKPILISDLRISIAKVKAVLSNIPEKETPNKLKINYEGGMSILDFDEILYLHGFDNLTTFYLTNNRKVTVAKTLKYFEDILQQKFFRIHKSYLVNLKFVHKILTRDAYFLELTLGTLLPISRRNYKDLHDILKK